ncbi:hypothetical protein MN116_007343 [Schistosoma mekongi]|uniref:Cadherin domain-containing protein n=1 Tax=Schistosoma mekongi TaxID=38744 RepID=A0AAE1Z957_SCHME|nr:hypothetical protein MN116_007343 [Schistosoma mekongi]
MYIAIHDNKHTEQSLTTNILINIFIDDLNDNSPQFLDNNIQTVYINESSLPELTKIPIKPAYDADFNEISNEFNALLNSTQNHYQSLNTTKLFIDSNGAIWCEEKIDRELIPFIDLIIGAHDLGEPKLTSYIKIRIIINDINDHSPEWQFPTDNDFIVIVSKSLLIGTIITRIHAIDKDETIKNGYINYYFYTLNNTNMYKSNYNMITYQIIEQFFALDTNSGELTVKYSLLTLPDGFLDIWLQAIDNGKVYKQSIAKLVLYLSSDIHNDRINFDNPYKLINYYKQNKSMLDITKQIHSLSNIHHILPMKMNTNISSMYLPTKQLHNRHINMLSLLISGLIIGVILLIVGLILFILYFKYKSCYHGSTKYDSVVPINTMEYHLNLTDNNNNSYNKHNITTICNELNTQTTTTAVFQYSSDLEDKYTEHTPNDINNNKEKFTELNGSNSMSLSLDNTTIQTYIPMSLMKNSTELQYTPITSMINLTDNIPLRLVHVTNDNFSVPLCMTHDNVYTTVEPNTTEPLTPQSLTIIAKVISTDQIKSNILPILSDESSTTDVSNAITNNKLYDNDTNIKLEYLTHSESYYPTYTPFVLTSIGNTS